MEVANASYNIDDNDELQHFIRDIDMSATEIGNIQQHSQS